MLFNYRSLWAFIAGIALLLLLVYWRGFFFQHALLVSLASAALVYAALRTWENMKSITRTHRLPEEEGDGDAR